MFKKNGTYVLIFLVLAVWTSLVILIIRFEQSQRLDDKSSSVSSVDERKVMTELDGNSIQPQFDTGEYFMINKSDIFFEEPFGLGDTTIFTEINFANEADNPYKDVVARMISAEDIAAYNLNMYPMQPFPALGNRKSLGKNILISYSGIEFLDVYDTFEQNQNLDFLTKYIYNIKDVDAYIIQKAHNRGYTQRGFAKNDDIINFENIQTRPEVKTAYTLMRNEMLKKGIRLHFVSGYRSSSSQRNIFIQKMEMINPLEILTGIHDQRLDAVLSRSAIPAYSKHHSGYAADFGCGNDYLVFSFAETPCYDWLSANNFAHARKYGFIPSYPDGVYSQGPNPEPWEYVWVGVENAK
jgi:hypothetical protein